MENQAPQRYTSLNGDEMNLAMNGIQPMTSPHRPRPWVCCFRNRRLEKVLLLLVLVLVLATSVLAIYTFIKLRQHISDNETSIIEVNNSDTSGRFVINNAGQCDNIYYTECYNWKRKNPTPKDWPYWKTFSKVHIRNYNKLSNIFENATDAQLESQAERKAKQFYLSCKDDNGTIERLGKQPIFDLIDKLGGWNISSTNTTTFNSSTFTSVELQETIQTLNNVAGVDSFFTIKVTSDDVHTKNNSNYILTLFPIEMPPGYSQNNYGEYMIKIAKLLEPDKDSVIQQMEAVFDFYKTLLGKVAHNPVKKAMNISELQNLSSFIQWEEYFRETIPTSITTLKSDDVVVLSDSHFFVELSKTVNDYLQTNGTMLKNFLVWRAVEEMTSSLPKAFEDARREQLRNTSNISMGRSPEYCVHITNTYFRFATAAVFAREVFDVNSTNWLKPMFNHLKKAFTKKLELLPLDQYNKQIMKNKADTMRLLIGFPKFVLDTNELDKYYNNVNVHKNAYFVNVLEARVNEYQRQFTLLGQNANKASWPFHLSLTSLNVNAIYCKETNQIVVPMGILEHKDLQLRQQMSFNFGTLGYLLAHEFMHAFVNRELSSDENGWPKQIREMFRQIHDCVYKNYSNCSSLKDCRTLNEDMADIGGIQLAYSAFLDWQAEQQQPATLKTSSKQQFFLTFVKMWCANGKNSQEFRHSSSLTRATKTLSYMPDFAHEFNCKPGSQLNPQRRCHVF